MRKPAIAARAGVPIGLPMPSWFRKHFERHEAPRQRRRTVPGVEVRYDDKTITVRRADGTQEQINWSDLAAVSIVTTDAGPFAADLFWVLTDRLGRRGATVPLDAEGEHELLKAMQGRLHGFDNMAVVEAMGSVANASFVVWDHARRDPD
jgi:hypothetical protein